MYFIILKRLIWWFTTVPPTNATCNYGKMSDTMKNNKQIPTTNTKKEKRLSLRNMAEQSTNYK